MPTTSFIKSWSPKDPDDIVDYELDWSARLGTDTITASEWIIAEGVVTINTAASGFTTTTTTVWLSEGVPEQVILTNRITTAGGRRMDQSVILKVVTK